jgi:Asp-tRNA(Asn)/Glu-tRNA(Gln) amidotransferase A subunit family amidase
MGSAAAVAAGMACAALGTQTNGSVIRPAAFCGVVGFKPTHGSIPVDGIMAFAPTLDTVGMFTRSVADAAWLAAALAVQSSAAAPIPAALPGPPRLAAVRSPVWPLSEEAQRRSFESSLTALRGAGASVTELELPDLFSQGHEAHRCIMAREAAEHLGPLTRLHRDRVSARLNALLDEGAGIADKRYREALELRGRLRDALSVFLRRFDAILTPPTPGEAPGTLDETGNPAFCTLWSLVGAPSITIPVQLGPHGLPLGLQIVGALGGDDRLMAVASWCEGACPGTALPD